MRLSVGMQDDDDKLPNSCIKHSPPSYLIKHFFFSPSSVSIFTHSLKHLSTNTLHSSTSTTVHFDYSK